MDGGSTSAERNGGGCPQAERFRHSVLRWTLGYWACIYVLLTVRSIVIPYDMLLEQGLLRLVMMAVGLILCAVVFRILEGIALAELPRRIPLVAAAALAPSLLYILINYHLFYVWPALWEPNRSPLALLGFYAIQFFWLFPFWVGLYFYLRYRSERPDETSRANDVRDLWIKARGTAFRVPVEKIHWLEAEGDYVRVHTAERSYLLRGTMRSMESALGAGGFIRIHRGVIAATRLIAAVERRPDSRIEALLSTGARLPVGRRYLSRLRALGTH